ncbi:bone morphogenetic protein 2-A-like [Choloepus didactylus]|uniref:bone morphogenetic protein 2-A-like n=1 Tax=Choloepus didactylus TaxID=27675 RepID=UPI00189DC68D|nr:bone morphogenetic protein 2-A-like [Choloepus didactylus]
MGSRAGLALLLLGLGVLAMEDQAWKKEKLVWEMGHLFKLEELGHAQGPSQPPPSFMLDLFKRVADTNGVTKDPKALRGNMVRCFQEKVHINQSHFFFNLSSVGKHEKVLRAELHVFKLRHLQDSPSHDQAHHYHRVEVHEVLGATPESERGRLLWARELPLTSRGWLVFDVTHTVASWIQREASARSFLVLTSRNMGRLLNYSSSGIDRKWDPRENRNSLLVVYTNNRDREPPRKDLLTDMPSAQWLPSEWNCPPQQEPPPNVTTSHCRQPRSVRPQPRGPVACQKHPLYVDFQDIGWNSWVISPRGYQVNYCKGDCVYPLGHRTNASNHASFMSFLSYFKVRADISRPSCVPNKLNSISLLYFDEQRTVVLRQYTDMMVDTCGCH